MSRSSFAARGPVARLGLEILEDRRTPAAMGGASELITAVAGDTGSSPIGALYNPTGEVRVFLPVYEGTFTGGVRVATADFTGDGEADLVAGPGPGRVTQVRVINGLTGVDVFTFTAFEETFTGGVFVATGDFNGDGVADIVVSPDVTGGPRVRVLSGTDPANVVLADFFGIEDVNFRGGARVGVGDVNG
ncbi:MAG TPA: VCBS repeat-containing protein, partial [Gemmataceae bacterium]